MPDSTPSENVEVSSKNSADICNLCGLTLRAGRHTAVHATQTYQFCCLGCRQVFSILMEAAGESDPTTFRQSELFKQCQELGIIPRSEADLLSSHADNRRSNKSPTGPIDPSKRTPHSATPAEGGLNLNLKVSNMWCPACAWLIDERLKKAPGVIYSTCNFSTDRLQVNYNPIRTSPDRIIDAVKKLGYRAAEPDASRDALERRKEFIRFAISAFLTMNIMMLSYALYSGFFTEFSRDTIYKLSWPAFVMATVVIIYGGFEFYKKAWFGLTNAAFSMETLIIIGSVSAYVYSTVNLFAGSIHMYFDTAAMLITLVLLGKTLESRAKGSVLEGLENFFSLKPYKVRICTDDYPAGRYVSADHLSEEDIFRIEENEIVPADGKVIDGSGTLDESSLTGEPLPIRKRPGDIVRSGTRVLKGSFSVSAQGVGANSTLGQMITIIEKTLMTKTPLEGKTDTILHWFVPIIIVLAAGTALVCLLVGISMEAAILRAVTVLVISCPCALGIAIPLARVAGISIAGKKGILVRDFKAFEQAERITALVFDKTGTITTGKWNLLNIICDVSITENQVLALAAGLEMDSDHFIAHEIINQAESRHIEPINATDIQHDAKGIQATFEGQRLKIGSADFLAEELKKPNALIEAVIPEETASHSFVYLGVDNRLAAIFVFGDTLRPDALTTVNKLKDRGLRLALLSGDGEQTTREISKRAGIRQSYGGQLPQDKSSFIAAWQQKGYRVAMVGDGINDAPALVQADLSIAVHSGGQLSREAADITLMRADTGQIIDFLNFARQVNKKISQNMTLTFLYNAFGIPIAMSGLLSPLVAVTAMLLSSLSVIGNTLILVRKNK